MEYIREILAKNLLELRKSKSLTQGQVATGIDATVASYSRWENGINWPDPESLEKLATYFEVPSSRLFVDDNLQRPPMPALDPQNVLIQEMQNLLNKFKS